MLLKIIQHYMILGILIIRIRKHDAGFGRKSVMIVDSPVVMIFFPIRMFSALLYRLCLVLEKAAKVEWKRLRDTFRLCLNKPNGHQKNGKIWKYYSLMTFLTPFMSRKE